MDSHDLNSSLSAGVYLYRKMRSLTAEECADELGISKTTLVKIEQKKANPTLDTVALIAKNMGCDPLTLLGSTGASNYFTAMLLMSLLEQGNRYSLDTLQQAVGHIQSVLELLMAAGTPEEKADETPK